MTKKKIVASILLILILAAGLFIPDIIKYRKVVKATASFPYEVGIANTIVTPCIPAAVVCTGVTLCNTLDVGRCALYSDVTGTMAGGMGNDVLLSNITVAQIGLTSGSSLIAAGLSPVLMDGGPAASIGGATLGLMRFTDKIINWFSRLI